MPHASPEEWSDTPPTELDDSSREAAQESSALEDVVEATLASVDHPERITQEEISALHAVVRRWGDVPLSLDPIAIELVEAIILANYSQLKRSPDQWRPVAVRIAKHLFESPAANDRLNNLWRRLVERS